MKKFFSFLAAATLAFGFTACEDVPAPYEINSEKSDTPVVPEDDDALINESFAQTLGSFTSVCTLGDYPWTVSYSCAQVTSFVDTNGDDEKENNEAESWLVSKTLDLTNIAAAHLNFKYILRYGNSNQLSSHYQVLVSKNYTAGSNIAEAEWEALPVELVQGSDWETWYETGDINLPAEYCSVNGVTVALRYKATTKAATWEVKDFTLKEGEGQVNPDEDAPSHDEVQQLPYGEEFSKEMGGFKSYTTFGKGEWIIDYQTAKASGYDNATKVTTEGTYYLISPQISLEGQTEVHLAYEYILRYNKGDENQQVLISTNFNAETPAEGWTMLNQTHTEGEDWQTFSKADIQIPAEYMGKQIRVAFRYNTNAESGSTWEVKNFSIAAGKASDGGSGEGGEGDTPDTPVTGDNLLVNGDFEGWTSGKPNHWKTTSSAGNATLSQSTDAHGGTYSVKVGGSTSKNMRIAYKEMTLKAGTYTAAFYAKAATAEGGSLCPGYAAVKDNGSLVYKYKQGDDGKNGYTNNLSATEWVKVENTFTLDADQELNLIVMNAKDPGKDILIDDFTLTTSDGGVIDSGTTEPEQPEEPTDPNAIFSETFAAGQGDFAIDDKMLPEGGTYVWKASSYGSDNFMKASAYVGSAKEAESWLISPVVDLSGVTSATLSFEHAGKFFGTPENETLLMARVEGGEWKQLSISDWYTNSDYTFVPATVSLNEFAGKKMQFAFVYKSTTDAAGTWEIKNVVVK